MVNDLTKRQLYAEQFKLHTQRVFDYQKDRLRNALFSIAGTFGYFAYVLAQKQTIEKTVPFALVLLVPFVLNSIGFIYNEILHIIIKRHVGFLNHIETNVFGWKPEWFEYRPKPHETRWWHQPLIPMSRCFWGGQILISLLVLWFVLCGGV